MILRKALVAVGVLLVSAGVIGTAWAVVLQLDTMVGYGIGIAIFGMQCFTAGYVLKLAAQDWPPTILVTAGIEIGERRERRRNQRERMGVVHGMGRSIGGQS